MRLESWVEETEAKVRKILTDHNPRCRNPRCTDFHKKTRPVILLGMATRPWKQTCPNCGYANHSEDSVIQLG